MKKDKWAELSISKKDWEELQKIRKDSVDVFQSELAKKLAYYKKIVNSLSKSKIVNLLSSGIEKKNKTEVIDQENLKCPACLNKSLALLIGLDVDWNQDGILEHAYQVMRCSVCEIELDRNEIMHIGSILERFLPDKASRKEWQRAIESNSIDENY